MKICVTTSTNKGWDTEVNINFGRTPYFAIVDLETMELEFIENTAADAASGAGVMAAQLVADQEIGSVISGKYGPKAFSGLKAANIQLFSFSNGSIKEAVEKYKKGELQDLSAPTNAGHQF